MNCRKTAITVALTSWLVFWALLFSTVLQAQVLQQVDSTKVTVTGETAKTLTFSFSWFDKNTLSDTLTYQLAWYDIDSTSHLVKQTANVVRTRQQTFTVTKPSPWTSAPYQACVTPTYPAKSWFAVCAAMPYLNFDTTARTIPQYPGFQRGKTLGGEVYTYTPTGNPLQLVMRLDVEMAKTPESSIEVPTTVMCSMFVTRDLHMYQHTADRWVDDCQQAFQGVFRFYRWPHGADSVVQQAADNLPVPATRCQISVQDGYAQRAITCP